jgi:chaperonin GroES
MRSANNFWHSYLSSANASIEGGVAACAGPRKKVPMKFRPLHDRVVIRRAEGDIKSKGGIIIPDTAKEKPQEGEVIAVGPGARDETGALVPLDVKAGDFILFGKWSGTEVKIDGEDLLIMKEADIMGVIDKSETGIIDKGAATDKTVAAKKAA